MNISASGQGVGIQSLADELEWPGYDMDDMWGNAVFAVRPSDAEGRGPIQALVSPKSPPRHVRHLYASIDLPEFEDDGDNSADAHCPTPPSRSSMPASRTAHAAIDEAFLLPLFVNALGLY